MFRNKKERIMDMIEEMQSVLVLLSTKENGFGDIDVEDRYWVASTVGYYDTGISYGSAEAAIRSLYFKWTHRRPAPVLEFQSMRGH